MVGGVARVRSPPRHVGIRTSSGTWGRTPCPRSDCNNKCLPAPPSGHDVFAEPSAGLARLCYT